jgi:hypothetical protein
MGIFYFNMKALGSSIGLAINLGPGLVSASFGSEVCGILAL